jgi:hypothetical protein
VAHLRRAVFMVYLDYAEPRIRSDASQRSKLPHSLRNAVCMPLSRVHELYAARFINGAATLERDLAPLPRVLRIMVLDDGLPPPLDMFSSAVSIGENLRQVPNLGPDWLAKFRRLVKS